MFHEFSVHTYLGQKELIGEEDIEHPDLLISKRRKNESKCSQKEQTISSNLTVRLWESCWIKDLYYLFYIYKLGGSPKLTGNPDSRQTVLSVIKKGERASLGGGEGVR